MANEQITVEWVATGDSYRFGNLEVQQIDLQMALEEVALLAPGSLLVAQEDPVSGRVAQTPRWGLRWAPEPENGQARWNSRQIRSLVQAWAAQQVTLRLSGADMLGLQDEPLRRETEGAQADMLFTGELGWWASGELVYVDGALQVGNYTVDSDAGTVLFDSPVDASSIVTCTVAREPQGTLTAPVVAPVWGWLPAVWDITATFREATPA
jgi:hypothetical protein